MEDGQNITVTDDLVVTLEYVLRLDDGQVIDRSDSEDPLLFLQGRGQIIPGLERSLYGMALGDEKEVKIAPEDAYGQNDPANLETMSRDQFPENLDLEVGMGIQMRDQESDEVYQAVVSDLKTDQVVLDFNHPLAGETLYFHVKVSGLRPATTEELAHGHAH